MPSSSYEQLTIRALKALFPRIQWQERIRPDWLRNPATNHRLELDLWEPKTWTAIEVQGPAHYRDVKGLSTPAKAEAQRQRDTFKRDRCTELGIKLVEVSIFHLADESRIYTLYLFLCERLGVNPMPRYQFVQHREVAEVIGEARWRSSRKVRGSKYERRKPGLWPLLQRTWRRRRLRAD